MEVCKLIELLANICVIFGAVITVITYKHTVKKERKINTIKRYTEIRNKYSNNTLGFDIEYMKELEFFCLGVNEKVYDIKILRRAGGRFLINQYDNKYQKLITDRRNSGSASDESWIEYEKIIQELKCEYCTEKKGIAKILCRFYRCVKHNV